VTTAVVKIGTSSLTDASGQIDEEAIERVATGVADLRRAGHQVVLVTSGAIAAGLPELGMDATDRPSDAVTLQAASSVGHPVLHRTWAAALSRHDLRSGQILLAPHNFGDRRQYLHARATLSRLLELGVVPVVNENDAVTDEEIRFGDNDRIAALVASLVSAHGHRPRRPARCHPGGRCRNRGGRYLGRAPTDQALGPQDLDRLCHAVGGHAHG